MHESLTNLAHSTDNQRDTHWEDRFLHALAGSSVQVLSPDPQTGPDGWPYLMVNTDTMSSDAPATEPVQAILQWLATRGMGMAVNPQKSMPDYVLTYGMIWSFRETGKFIRRGLNFDEDFVGEIKIGSPTSEFLPVYVRAILREFFRDQGILEPRITVATNQGRAHLIFSLDSLRNPPAHEHAGIAEAIGWFLPTHYVVRFATEESLPHFEPL